MIHSTRAAVLSFLLFLLGACSPGGGPPDVILVTIDAIRADRIGTAEGAGTPTLDALAAEGAVFERTFASAPLSLPSHATLLTGLEPHRHGIRDDGDRALDEATPTVATRLADVGYDTAAILGSEKLDAVYGLARGFELYDDAMPWDDASSRSATGRRSGEEVTSRAIAWLERERGGPAFVWVHYSDLVAPRTPPSPFDESEDVYAATLSYVDTQLGRLVEAARSLDGATPIMLVVGAHGEALGARGEWGHGLLAFDHTLHVPLVAVGPGFAPGTRSADFVQTRDVAATLVGAAGAESLANGALPLGQSTGEAASPRIGSFETLAPQRRFAWSPLRGVRDARWKYTAEPAPVALYDVVADPGETQNVADEEPEVVARLQQAHEAVLAEERGAGTPPVSAGPAAGTDPRRAIVKLPAIELALAVASSGNVAKALGLLRIMAEDHPELRARAYQAIAVVNRSAGRTDASIEAHKRWVALTGSVESRLGLAAALLDDGQHEQALAVLEGVESASARVRIARGEALRLLGRYDEALAETSAILRIHPDDDRATALEALVRVSRDGPFEEIDRLEAVLTGAADPSRMVQSRAVLAQLLIDQRRFEEAARVLRMGPTPPRLRAMLARIMADHGRIDQAIALYEAALVDRPGDPEYRRALADLFFQQNRANDAIAVYDAMIDIEPDDASLYADRGAVHHTAGRLELAASDYQRALALDEALAETHYNLALLAEAAGREGEAEAHLLQAVEIREDYPKAHLLLARIYGGRDDPRSARHAELAVITDTGKPVRAGGSVGDSPRP